MTLDPDGNFVMAVNHRNRIVRIDSAGKISTIVENGGVRFSGERRIRRSNALREQRLAAHGGTPAAHPGLVRVDGY